MSETETDLSCDIQSKERKLIITAGLSTPSHQPAFLNIPAFGCPRQIYLACLRTLSCCWHLKLYLPLQLPCDIWETTPA